MSEKIRPQHLERNTILPVRQSSLYQALQKLRSAHSGAKTMIRIAFAHLPLRRFT